VDWSATLSSTNNIQKICGKVNMLALLSIFLSTVDNMSKELFAKIDFFCFLGGIFSLGMINT
jgi:hypothetical protein